MTESTLLALLLVSLWTAAWLHWFFEGDLRHFLFAHVFPETWLGGKVAEEIMLLDSDNFEIFLAVECSAPKFIRGVLGCPGCLSTYVSAAGTAIAACYMIFACGLPPASLIIAPLIWAPSAWIGHRLHNYL